MPRKFSTSGTRFIARGLDMDPTYISRMKKKGEALGDPFPLDNVEKARKWLDRHTVKGSGTRGYMKGSVPVKKGDAIPVAQMMASSSGVLENEMEGEEGVEKEKANDTITAPQTDTIVDPATGVEKNLGIGMASLEMLLQNALTVERSSFRTLEKYKKNADTGKGLGQINVLTKAYNEASARVESLQETIRKERVIRGELITLDDHKIGVSRMVVPQVMLLRKLPRVLALKINPQDDGTLEMLLAGEVEVLIEDLLKGLTLDPVFHLECFITGMMLECPDGVGIVERLEEKVAEVKGLLEQS